jgi:hypothetical protein
MMNNKGSINKYPAAHAEKNSKFAPILSFSTCRNQIFIFFFYFLIFFLNQGHKNRNSTKYQLKPIKDVIGTNLGAFEKAGAGTSELESSAFLIFFELFKNTLPGNRSSEQKVMPILRRTL